jgi:hypothetical protein
MRSNPIERWRHFRIDVEREITFLLNRFGDRAHEQALAAAAKPNLRTRRRKVLLAAAKALDPTPRLFGLIRLPKQALGRKPTRQGGPSSAMP